MNDNLKDIIDLIPSFSLGTLNREEHTRLFDNYKSLPKEEVSNLAEYQELTALLSVMIDVSEPPKDVKVNIAKKLAHFKRTETVIEQKQEVIPEEIKPEEVSLLKEETVQENIEPIVENTTVREPALIQEPVTPINDEISEESVEPEEKEETRPEEEVPQAETVPEEADSKLQGTIEELTTEEEELLKESQKYYQGQLELFAEEDKSQFIVDYEDPEDLDGLPLSNEPGDKEQFKKEDEKKQHPRKSKAVRNIDYVIAGAILALLIVVVLVFLSLNSEITGISKRIGEIPDRNLAKYEQVITSVREYLYNRKILDNVLLSDRMMYIELRGTKSSGSNSGKLLLDIQERTGFLVLTGMPKLAGNKVFRLWISTPTAVNGIDLKQSDASDSFYEVINLPVLNENESLSIVISEEVIGSNNATNSPEVYYSGEAMGSLR